MVMILPKGFFYLGDSLRYRSRSGQRNATPAERKAIINMHTAHLNNDSWAFDEAHAALRAATEVYEAMCESTRRAGESDERGEDGTRANG